MDKEFNPPAHPQPAITNDTYARNEWHEGMSLRDWFAGQALVGIISALESHVSNRLADATRAYEYADAMLTARRPKRPETIDDL